MSLTEEKKTAVEENIIDIDLSPIRKKRFRINGDNDKILELNTSDVSIFNRLQDAYPKLEELASKATALGDDTDGDEDGIKKFTDTLKEIDTTMRESIDYIFDSNVSEVCAPFGSMYDPLNGKFRYEHIIETLAALYENNFDEEVRKIKNRVTKHTDKYTKKKKR